MQALNEIGLHAFYQNRHEIIAQMGEVDSWQYVDSTDSIYIKHILFIGQTGVGKSSTINSLVHENIMETDDIESCTKTSNSALFCLDKDEMEGKHFLSLCDMPGISENSKVDKDYFEWYKGMADCSDCIVYIVRADSRAHERDEFINDNILKYHKNKLVIGINQVDKIEPLNRNSLVITQDQTNNINKRITEIQSLFHPKRNRIVPYSTSCFSRVDLKEYSKYGYNLNALIEQIQNSFLSASKR